MKYLLLMCFLASYLAAFSQNTITTPDPDPNVFIITDREPQPLNLDQIKTQIGYPTSAKQANIQGRVVVRVLMDEKGSYVKHIVIKDPHPILTKAVVDQLPILRCTSAISNGKPIKYWITLPFLFRRIE